MSLEKSVDAEQSSPLAGPSGEAAAPAFTDDQPKPGELWHVGPCHLGYGLDNQDSFSQYYEGPWEYLPGGHHPIHLGDIIGGPKKYKVLHKLGSGRSANVWFCSMLGQDPPFYVAVKVLKACASQPENNELTIGRFLRNMGYHYYDIVDNLTYPWRDFTLEGPNGTHQCFVYPVQGPTVCKVDGHFNNPHVYLRELTRKAAYAMGVTQGCNMIHNDFRPSNILIEIGGLAGKSEEEVMAILGEPQGANVVKYPGADATANPPEYIIFPASENLLCQSRETLTVIDFGNSFREGKGSPPRASGAPSHYAAPEVVFSNQGQASLASDIWALACTLYEIRFGEKLFHCESDHVEGYIHALVKHCGKVPERWWSAPPWNLQEAWHKSHSDPRLHGGPATEEAIEPEATVRWRHIQAAVAKKVAHPITSPESVRRWEEARSAPWVPGTEPVSMAFHECIPEEEQRLFADLLYKMTELEPAKRLVIAEVAAHPWFDYVRRHDVPDGPASPHGVEDVESGAGASDTGTNGEAEAEEGSKTEPESGEQKA
ncbi:uncharacterized protein DSM5745_09264 [Aspergillus mulundensis]|uniref:Protein kinase domain-containing protein n=1 Tax=Aspergillus mulundensis TaxID=1810919 RepID=A0A3D8R0C5_9EURO|nr:hypothetical protein DSM5745_09264 [Aspergillus mulundensis]RDW67398.1 hypothetical protein DSM5745_09264 [Aspergillus mulundensis]